MEASDAMQVDADPQTKDENAGPRAVVENWVPPPTENHHAFSDGSSWILTCWDETTSTPDRLRTFHERWPPSRTPQSYGSWIMVDRGGSKTNTQSSDIQGLQESFQALVESNSLTTISLDAIAMQHNVLNGKWLVFTDWKHIDLLWARIVNMVCTVRKRGNLKVSTRKERMVKKVNVEGVEVEEEERHVICVYVDDYTDIAEVKALREDLRRVGVKWKIGFKPDAYTYLGIYTGNKWKINISRYFF